MTTGLHDTGEEYIVDVIFDGSTSRVTSAQMTLFNDSNDALSESSDVGNISEPQGSSYARQTVDFDTNDVTNSDASGDWQSEFVKQVNECNFPVLGVEIGGSSYGNPGYDRKTRVPKSGDILGSLRNLVNEVMF